jgi:hypothetical protein
MTSMFKPKNIKPTFEARPVKSLAVYLFVISSSLMLLQSAISDVTTHPIYVLTKAIIVGIGCMIWLNALKSNDLGSGLFKYIGFIVISSVFQFFVFLGSYGSYNTTSHQNVV